jgi:hypothetical protein
VDYCIDTRFDDGGVYRGTISLFQQKFLDELDYFLLNFTCCAQDRFLYVKLSGREATKSG